MVCLLDVLREGVVRGEEISLKKRCIERRRDALRGDAINMKQ